MGGIIGGKPKVQGPDPELVAAQKRQNERLDKAEAKESREESSRRRLLRANQGRGGPVTLFAETGEKGVSTLGGR